MLSNYASVAKQLEHWRRTGNEVTEKGNRLHFSFKKSGDCLRIVLWTAVESCFLIRLCYCFQFPAFKQRVVYPLCIWAGVVALFI